MPPILAEAAALRDMKHMQRMASVAGQLFPLAIPDILSGGGNAANGPTRHCASCA